MMMMAEHREGGGGEGHTVMFTVLTAASPTHTLLHEATSANTNFPALKSFLLEFLFFQELLAGALIPQ